MSHLKPNAVLASRFNGTIIRRRVFGCHMGTAGFTKASRLRYEQAERAYLDHERNEPSYRNERNAWDEWAIRHDKLMERIDQFEPSLGYVGELADDDDERWIPS